MRVLVLAQYFRLIWVGAALGLLMWLRVCLVKAVKWLDGRVVGADSVLVLHGILSDWV